MLGEGWTAGAYGSSKTGWKFNNGDGIIDEQIFSDSVELRNLTLKLDGSNQWNVSSFRNAEPWKDIIAISDKIKQQIQQKWNEKEIQELFNL